MNRFKCSAAMLSLILATLVSSMCLGQGARSYPNQQYYTGLAALREGALKDGIDLLESSVRSGRTDVNGKWIDSIPAYAMLGECYYQVGDVAKAHGFFDEALKLFVRNQGWISRVDWSARILPNRATANVGNWATSTRNSAHAGIPINMQLMIGSVNILDQIPSGQPIQTAQVLRIDVAEVMRTLAWCLYRRTNIMGGLAVDEPLTEQVVAALQKENLPVGTAGRPWINLVLALALIADNQPNQALPLAQRSVQLAGQMDHPLTPIALLTVANLLVSTGSPSSTTWHLEAAISAARYEQYEVMSEAFRIAVGPVVGKGSGQLYAPARGAAVQLGRRSRLISATCWLTAAESAAMSGNLEDGKRALGDARAILSRRSVTLPRLEAYGNYVGAILSYQGGDNRSASQAIESTMSFAYGGGGLVTSPHQYQLGLVQAALAAGSIGGRTADALFEDLLKPARLGQWYRDPVDALSTTRTNQVVSEMRVASLIQRQKNEEAFQEADRLLGNRFRSFLPLSGRMHDVRWLMSADPTLISQEGRAIRAKPPKPLAMLANRLTETSAIQKALAAMPITPADAPGKALLEQTWESLAAAAVRSENLVSELAIRRMHIPRMFPPTMGDKSMWPTLASGNAILVFCPAGDNLIAMLHHEGKITAWRVEKPVSLASQITRLLGELGVKRRRGGAAQLGDAKAWQEQTALLKKQVLAGMSDDVVRKLKHLVVVPYGSLWYLPFEIMPFDDSYDKRLGEAVKISYAPTPGLAINPLPVSPGNSTAGITNRFFLPQDLELSGELDQDVLGSIENTIHLPSESSVSGAFIGTRLDRIWIASLLQAPDALPLNFSPLAYDADKIGGSLADWLRYPWGAPSEVLMPGFQSSIVRGAKPTGTDIFMVACGLHAAGVKTVLVSRWPVAGASTASLMSEYLSDVPFSTPLDAWQRSLVLLKGQELDPSLEPILSKGDSEGGVVTGEHPLFWSGYMMFGAALEKDE